MVGHSFGGQIVRQYAATYPHEVVGLVLVDVLPEQLRPLMTVPNWKTYTGLNSKPPHGLEQYKDIEVEDFDISFAQTLRAVAASPLRAMPIVVLSKGRPFDLAGANVPAGFRNALDSDWSKAQVQLVASLPKARHVIVADSSHNIEIDRPDLVLNAIRHVVKAVRAGRDWVGEARLNPGGR